MYSADFRVKFIWRNFEIGSAWVCRTALSTDRENLLVQMCSVKKYTQEKENQMSAGQATHFAALIKNLAPGFW